MEELTECLIALWVLVMMFFCAFVALVFVAAVIYVITLLIAIIWEAIEGKGDEG